MKSFNKLKKPVSFFAVFILLISAYTFPFSYGQNGAKSFGILAKAEDTQQQEIIEEPAEETELQILSPKSLNVSKSGYSLTSSYVISGISDKSQPVFLNGKEIATKADGSFSVSVKLNRGENKFEFLHKEKSVICNINYRYIVLKSISHTKQTEYAGNKTFTVAAKAQKGSKVTATFNGKTVTLKAYETVDANLVKYTGKFTMPAASLFNRNLGSIKFTATKSKVSEALTSAYIINKRNTKLLSNYYISKINIYSAETFDGSGTDDLSRPTNAYLPKGTLDYCSKKIVYDKKADNRYVKMAYGKKTYLTKPEKPGTGKITVTKRYKGTLPDHNDISFASLDISGNHTYITVNSNWKAPISFNLYPQEYVNKKAQDYRISKATYTYLDIKFYYSTSFKGSINLKGNPLFKSYKIIRGTTGFVLRLYLKNTGCFYGWDCNYNSNGQLVFRFLNPVKAKTANNKYKATLNGIKIFIDAGHGGIDGGASGLSPKKHPESERNLYLALKLQKELKSLGATVTVSRTANKTVTYDQRCIALMNTAPDLCISIHHDSSASSSAYGFGCFYFDAFSRNAAASVYSATKSASIYKKNSLNWHYFYLARVSTCPVVLTENGFISNKSEYSGIVSEAINAKKVQAITKGVVNYFKNIK